MNLFIRLTSVTRFVIRCIISPLCLECVFNLSLKEQRPEPALQHLVDKALAAPLSFHMGNASSLSCCASNLASYCWPGKIKRRWSKSLSPWHPHGNPDGGPGSWIHADSSLTMVPSEEWCSKWTISSLYAILAFQIKKSWGGGGSQLSSLELAINII